MGPSAIGSTFLPCKEASEMDTGQSLRRTLAQAGRDLRDQLRHAATEDGHVNVAGRHNVVVAGSVGADDEVHAASSSQRVRIRQSGDEQVEEVVTSTDATSP
jgi:hypothetical protein